MEVRKKAISFEICQEGKSISCVQVEFLEAVEVKPPPNLWKSKKGSDIP